MPVKCTVCAVDIKDGDRIYGNSPNHFECREKCTEMQKELAESYIAKYSSDEWIYKEDGDKCWSEVIPMVSL